METKQIEEILNVLSEKLSVPTSYLWEVSAEGMRLEGIINFTSSVVFILLVILGLYITYKELKKEDEENKKKEYGNNEGGLFSFYVFANIV